MSRIIYEYKIKSIIDHTKTIREVILEIINPAEFKFKAGQFVMLHVPVEGSKAVLRAYSIASADQDVKSFSLLFKYVDTGKASEYIWALSGHEILNFTGPFGKVFFQEPPTDQIIFLNTGSGLSQHMCFLLSKMEQYPNLKYKLFFGVRSEADIYFEAELKKIQKQIPYFEYSYVLSRPTDSWTGKKGYVQNYLNTIDYKNIPTTFYLCGNGGMIKDVKHQLLEIDGLDKTQVWSEAFD